MSILNKITACTLAVLVSWSSTAQAQVVVVPIAPHTLWRFIGIPQGIQKIRDVTTNRRGNRPGMERRPAMMRIADPANLASDNPAIKAAAEIKQAEDMKKQKIKAIKYLATIGCGCYDKDGKITAALVAATDDCTPDVRMAAVEAISDAASGECCRSCGSTSCCNEDIGKRLSELAYERDDSGCPLEPNADIRAAAKRALCTCCPNRVPFGLIEEDFSEEDSDGEGEPEVLEEAPIGETGEDDEDALGESDEEMEEANSSDSNADAEEDIKTESNSDEQALPDPADDQASNAELGSPEVELMESGIPEPIIIEPRITELKTTKPNKVLLIGGMQVQPVSISPTTFESMNKTVIRLPPVAPTTHTPKTATSPAQRVHHRSYRPVGGKVTFINHKSGELLVRADQINRVTPNGTVDVFHRYLTGERQVGRLKVQQVGSKMVKARVSDLPNIGRIHVGDRVILR
jgi:hypothetical protein